MEILIQALRQLQSSVFIYYTKAHGYHWNVEGILFEQFHDMFSDIYNDAWSSVDDYAEWIRIFGQKANFNVQNALFDSNVKYDLESEATNPMAMLSSLNNSNDLIIADLKNAFNTATAVGEQGVANFIADRITAHEKWRWKITSSLKTMGSN